MMSPCLTPAHSVWKRYIATCRRGLLRGQAYVIGYQTSGGIHGLRLSARYRSPRRYAFVKVQRLGNVGGMPRKRSCCGLVLSTCERPNQWALTVGNAGACYAAKKSLMQNWPRALEYLHLVALVASFIPANSSESLRVCLRSP